MIRTLFAIMCTLLLTGFFGVGVIFASLIDSSCELQHKIGQVWGRCLLSACRIKVIVQGFSNVAPSGTYIFMSNHPSNADIPVLQAFLPGHFKWLAKAELFRIPFFGSILKRAGYISIDRSNRESAIDSLARASGKIKDGKPIVKLRAYTRETRETLLNQVYTVMCETLEKGKRTYHYVENNTTRRPG